MFRYFNREAGAENGPWLPYYPKHAGRVRLAVYFYALIVFTAIAIAYMSGQLLLTAAEPCLLVAVVAILLYAFHARAGSRGQRQAIFEWASNHYDVQLSAVALRNLTRPTRDEGYVYGDWSSLPVNVLFENESGEEGWVEVRLCREGGYWFLYSPDYGKELPAIEPNAIEASLLPLLTEIIEHNGVFVVAPDGEDWNGHMMDATDLDTGEKALLFWTDQLRAELWLGGEAQLPQDTKLSVKELDYFGFLNGFLGVARKSYAAVGVNWGAEGYTTFTPKELQRFFNEHLAAVEIDDEDDEEEDG